MHCKWWQRFASNTSTSPYLQARVRKSNGFRLSAFDRYDRMISRLSVSIDLVVRIDMSRQFDISTGCCHLGVIGFGFGRGVKRCRLVHRIVFGYFLKDIQKRLSRSP